MVREIIRCFLNRELDYWCGGIPAPAQEDLCTSEQRPPWRRRSRLEVSEYGGIKMNRLDGGRGRRVGWGQRSGAATEVLSGESHGSRGGAAGLLFLNKNGRVGGAANFHLEPGQQDLCHIPKKLGGSIHLLSRRLRLSGAINALLYSLNISSSVA